jgi:serine/threonine protein kinase
MNRDPVDLALELTRLTPSEREDEYERLQASPSLRANVERLLEAELKHDSRTGNDSAPRAHVTATEPLPLRAIGRYEIVRMLGRGGNGTVYLTYDPVLDRDVAVKLITGSFDDAAAQARLELEARAAGRLRHANIVTIFDAGDHEGTPYIAMEYVPGETLRSVIRRKAELPLPRRIEIIEGACTGLAHAHRAGVVHLDVKPDNLILDETGIVKVLDFGIARVLRSEMPVTNHHVGTLRYMSPEQVSGEPLDRRSDVFSLGCSCFELVAYAPAYSGSTHEMISRIAEGPVPRLLDVVPEVDPRLDAIVARAMALQPADRFEDLDQLRTELEQLRREMDPGTGVHLRSHLVVPEGRGSSSGRRRSNSRTAPWQPGLSAWVGAGSVVVIGLGALWALGGRPASTPEIANAGPAPVVRPAVPTGPAASNGADDVWRRLAIGDRPAVLRLLRPGGTNDGPAADARLATAVIDAVRTTVRQARDAAGATPVMRASEMYRQAEGQLARANRLEAERKPLDALGALWQAGDLYGRVTAPGQPPTSQTASAATATPPVAEPSASVPGRVAHDPPVVPVEPPAPVATPPAAEAVSAAAAPAPSVTRVVPVVPSDTDAVISTLRRYTNAYKALDLSGVLQVFPGLAPNQVDEIRRTFAAVTSYEMEARQPRVNVVGDVATVRAVVSRRMVTRVGRPFENEVENEFQLRRAPGGWQITDVRVVK